MPSIGSMTHVSPFFVSLMPNSSPNIPSSGRSCSMMSRKVCSISRSALVTGVSSCLLIISSGVPKYFREILAAVSAKRSANEFGMFVVILYV